MASEAAGGVGRIIDVAEVIGRQKLGGFVVGLVLISCIVTLFDGFDMLVISFVAPYIGEEFGLDKVQLGILFSWGTFGAMVGGFGFGWLGDRMGRRPTIIASVLGFGLTAIGLAMAQTYEELVVIRFLNGVALGGLMPLAWALNIEFVPGKYRATVVTLIMMGYTLGGAIAGPLTVWIAPVWSWRGVFLVSGVATLVLVAILWFVLPESARYLAIKRRSSGKIARMLNRIEPGLGARESDNFTVSDEAAAKRGDSQFHARELFAGRLAMITPLLWSAYIGSSLAIYFKASWGPILFESVGLTRTDSAYVSSISSLTGALAGLALMRFTDRYGPIAIAAFPLLSAPLLVLMGLADVGPAGFVAFSIVSMTLIGGMHFGMHSIAGVFYPSAIRANGAGWATSVAKVGSIAGPMLGGFLLGAGLPPRHSFLFLAAAPLLCGVSLLLLSRFARWKAEQKPAAAPDAEAEPAAA